MNTFPLIHIRIGAHSTGWRTHTQTYFTYFVAVLERNIFIKTTHAIDSTVARSSTPPSRVDGEGEETHINYMCALNLAAVRCFFCILFFSRKASERSQRWGEQHIRFNCSQRSIIITNIHGHNHTMRLAALAGCPFGNWYELW